VVAVCLLAASTWHVFGHTWDEPEHLAAGLELLDRGHYEYDIQHPPLGRVMMALGPWLAGAHSVGKAPPDGRAEGVAVLYGSGRYSEFLTLARAGVLPFLALLIVATYLWARTVLDPGGALGAAVLVGTAPAVVGLGALATLDVPAVGTCFLALYCFRRWLLSGRLRDAAVLGLAGGLALGTKLTAVPFCGLGGLVLLGLHLLDVRQNPPERAPVPAVSWWAGSAAVVGIVGVVLTWAYGGRIIYLTDRAHHFNQALGYLFGYKTGLLHDPAYWLFARVPVPEAFQWFVGAIQAVTVHNDNGHWSYCLGELRRGGWPAFYLLALAVKTPWPLLFGGLAGLLALVRDGWQRGEVWRLAPPVLFVVWLTFASLFSHINIGIRHVLVLYPLLAIGLAYVLSTLWRWGGEGGRGRQLARLLVILLVVGEAVTVASTWPDYLAYFNGFAPVPEKILVDSDLDWGQDFKRLTTRLRDLRIPSVSLAYLGTAELPLEPLPPYRLLKPDEPATGWVAVSALARAFAPGHDHWLDGYTPRERIGRTIDLYYIPPR